MALTAQQIAEQRKQVEEMIAGADVGFAKALFFGKFKGELLFPFPVLPPDKQAAADEMAAKVKRLRGRAHRPHADRPRRPDSRFGRRRGWRTSGLYKATIPTEFGGLGFGQQQYLKTMEILGGHDASVAVFVNAHHSIGVRALVLFGTKEQQAKWLPGLFDGSKLCAFALTEPEAGSDAGNVQTTATPTEDGSAYILNGTKHYITNGGIAHILTVMARTPAPDGEEQGDGVPRHARHAGLRGRRGACARSAASAAPRRARCASRTCACRRRTSWARSAAGLQAALTVLNYGRVTFGATCTGHAKVCIKAMIEHAKRRVQFQQPLAEFQLVQKKIAFAAAHCFAMEAATAECAAFIDQGSPDYMLETAILKVFSTEHLWPIVNDTLQVWGGKGYFSRPADRAVDARRPDQHHRRGGQRRAEGVHRGGRLPRAGDVPEGDAGRGHRAA